MLRQTIDRFLRPPSSRVDDGEDAIALISAQDASDTLSSHSDEPDLSKEATFSKPPLIPRIRGGPFLIGFAVIFFISLAIVYLTVLKDPSTAGALLPPLLRESSNLYLLLSSSHLDTNVCKMIMSATILGYPAPRLVRIGEHLDHSDQDLERAKAHMSGVLEQFETWDEKAHGRDPWHEEAFDNETVIVLGTQVNTWFQLRPEVFFQRFYEVQQREMARSAQNSSSHSVIFATQGVCPDHGNNPDDCVLGLESGESDLSWHKIDSRLAIGSIGAVKALYKAALDRAERDSPENDEAGLLTALLREQQRTPELARNYSIGLDFGGQLSYTLPAEDNAFDWVDYGKTSQSISSGATALTPPILYSQPPFWTTWSDNYTSARTWAELTLLTATSSPSSSSSSSSPLEPTIPAIIHLDHAIEAAHRDAGHGDRRVDAWGRLWFVPAARRLLRAATYIPTVPVATVLDPAGVVRRLINPSFVKAGLEMANGDQMRWGEVCGDEAVLREVFRDDRGEWVDEVTW